MTDPDDPIVAGNPPEVTDAVEAYLDDLADRLRLRGRHLRHVLAEVDDHLAAARAAGMAEGLDDDAAARRAVAEFGPADLVARRLSRNGSALTSQLVRQGAQSLTLVGAIGLLAIGLSGLLAWGAGAAFGKPFVSGDAPGVTYTAARCAEYHEYAPGEPTCAKAAVAHHFTEVVGYRLDAGILGLVVLAVWLGLVRPWRRGARAAATYDALPEGFAATVGAALFGAAAAITLPGGLMELVFGGRDNGAGALLSAGVVSTLAFAGFALSLWRSLSAAPGGPDRGYLPSTAARRYG
jgi:hypothetical protein